MKQPALVDRVVVEIKDTDSRGTSHPAYVAAQLRKIADAIEYDGMNGDIYQDMSFNDNEIEVLWERECPEFGGFRMGSESLITEAYYRRQPKYELFPGIGKALSELAIRANIRKLSDKVESL